MWTGLGKAAIPLSMNVGLGREWVRLGWVVAPPVHMGAEAGVV